MAAVINIRFRDQYIGLLPMRQIKAHVTGRCVQEGHAIDLDNACIRAKVHAMYDAQGRRITSALIEHQTMGEFHSETAKIFILLQIARESFYWDHYSGQTFLEKAINGFLAALFERWHTEGVNHIVSIVLFGHIHSSHSTATACVDSGGVRPFVKVHSDGVEASAAATFPEGEVANEPGQQHWRDFYSVVVDWESHLDWRLLLPRIRKEAINFFPDIARLFSAATGGRAGCQGEPLLSSSQEGNIVQATHLALQIFDKHFVDRDLSKAGMSIIMVSPGSGHFRIEAGDTYNLCRLAKRKIIDDGIWMQLVCLGPAPLHVAPLLEIVDCSTASRRTRHYRPYWMRCGYFSDASQWATEDAMSDQPGRGEQSPRSAALSPTNLREPSYLPSAYAIWPVMPPLNEAILWKEEEARRPHRSQAELPCSITQVEGGIGQLSICCDAGSIRSREACANDSNDHVCDVSSTLRLGCKSTYNPCDPQATPMKHCPMCYTKWSALSSDGGNDANMSRIVHRPPHWSTMVAPPCMPLKTTFCPHPAYLAEQFARITSAVFLGRHAFFRLPRGPDALLGEQLAELKDELVAFRTSFGMQSIWQVDADARETTLCLNHEYHVIAVKDDHVLVTRYVRHIQDGSLPIKEDAVTPYGAYIKPLFHKTFMERSYAILPSTLHSFPWNAIDRMISGSDAFEVPNGHYWQSRFVLIPALEAPRSALIIAADDNETLTDDELRIVGFAKLVEIFHRAALSKPTAVCCSLPASAAGAEGNKEDAGCAQGGDCTAHRHTASHRMRPFEPIDEQMAMQSPLDALAIEVTDESPASYVWRARRRHLEEAARNGWGAEGKSAGRSLEREGDAKCLPASPLPRCSASSISDGAAALHDHIDIDCASRKELIARMLHATAGLPLRDRSWEARVYHNVFIGSQGVDWIMANCGGVRGRAEATALGNRLMELGIWRHAREGHRFRDGYYYYTLVDGCRPAEEGAFEGAVPCNYATSAGAGAGAGRGGVIEMSRSLVMDVDVQRRNAARREWSFFHYDATFNPRTSFHFRLHWLSCSTRLIDDFVQTVARRATLCGFSLIEMPVDVPASAAISPFQAPICIPFAACPPAPVEEHVHRLLLAHAFVIDQEGDASFPPLSPEEEGEEGSNGALSGARHLYTYDRPPYSSTQYVHRSGVAIVQLKCTSLPSLEGGDDRQAPRSAQWCLLWSINRLLLAAVANRRTRSAPHLSGEQKGIESDLRASITGLLSSPERLSAFFGTLQQPSAI